MPKDQKAPHDYPHGRSQLKTNEDYLSHPITKALQQAANAGRDHTRLLLKINLYEPSQVRGGSGRYVSWPTMRWKHDVKSVKAAQHFAQALDKFVALYQQSPTATVTLLQAQDFSE